MIIEKIISILASYLGVDNSELTEDTLIFIEYDLDDEDIQNIIVLFEDEFDIEIDLDELCELSTIEEFAEYIESLI